MNFKAKLDEGLSHTLMPVLTAHKYEAYTVRGQGWGGMKDRDLWPAVQAEQAFLITIDKGFGDIRRYPPGTHAGVLVLRPDNESLSEYTSLLGTVLASHSLTEFAGCVVVATPRSIRVRRSSQKPPM